MMKISNLLADFLFYRVIYIGKNLLILIYYYLNLKNDGTENR